MQYLLHGGGIDSTLLFVMLLDQFKEPMTLVHIDYGQLAAEAELFAIKEQANLGMIYRPAYQIQVQSLQMDLGIATGQLFTGNHEDSPEIPDRNGQLLQRAFEGNPDMYTIWVGADPVPDDKTPMADCVVSYFQEWSRLYSKQQQTGMYLVMTPFLYMTYDRFEDYLRRTIFHANYKHIMAKAMTCWTPRKAEHILDMHCGECAHCKKYTKFYGYDFQKERSRGNA